MTDHTELTAREHEALLALEQIRAAVAAIPDNHPTAAPLAKTLALAEEHWRECQVAAKATGRNESTHPDDYWSARWRT